MGGWVEVKAGLTITYSNQKWRNEVTVRTLGSVNEQMLKKVVDGLIAGWMDGWSRKRF